MNTAIVLLFALVAVALGHSAFRHSRVVGGEEADEGQFPYIASVRYYDQHNCGGNIIGKRFILTAGHCVYGYDPASITVVVGTNSLSSGGQKYAVRRLTPHEKYGTNAYGYDIGLIELTEDIDFSQKNVTAIKVETVFLINEEVTLAGWGSTSAREVPDKLQFINLKTITVEECKKEIQTDETEICTLTKAGEGACFGDSGGPLVFKGKLTGLVSRGYPCALGRPDVYTRPLSYCGWLSERTNGEVNC